MALLRRSISSFLVHGSRLKIWLTFAFIFALVYVFILSNSVSQKPLDYATKIAVNVVFKPTTPEDERAALNRLLDETLYVGNGSVVEEEAANAPDLEQCPNLENITNYIGRLHQATLLIEDLTEDEVAEVHSDIQLGGFWRPSDCKAVHKVAVVIPYRDRKSHLVRLLDFLIPILQKQKLDFRFIVTEQYGDDLFNKGRIMNAAFQYAQKLHVDCVIFHDVDMFPQDDRTPYGCPDTPRHLGAFVSNLGYQLWYKEIVGGALSIRMTDYLAVNGYSNLYWAWGGEDDDMGKRILSRNYVIERPNQEVARYSMLKHVKRKRTAPKLIYKLLDSADTRWATDGVNETGLWTIKSATKRPLYHHLLVDVGESPVYWRGS